MADYPVTARIEVRWRDIDALGHVNNAVYFTYFEIARAHYWETAFRARTLREVDFLVASIHCDFLSPTRYGETVAVGIRVSGVGRTSFDFEYEARTLADRRPVARATSTQVLYDHGCQRKLEIGGEWVQRIAEIQGEPPPKRPR